MGMKPPFSTAQLKVLYILPKITGTISAILSAVIVWVVLRSPKRRRQTFHRMMAALSIIDTQTSLWNAMSTWPAPRDSGVLFALGNDRTCTVQGTFLQFGGITSILYNLSLSFYYLLVIRFGWKDRAIARIEPLLHGLPLAWGLGTSLSILLRGQTAFSSLWCWIGPEHKTERLVFFYGPLFLTFAVIFINSILTWRHVHQTEKKMAKYSNFSRSDSTKSTEGTFRSTQKNDRDEFKMSRKLAWQCVLFAGAFYLTWGGMSITRILQVFELTYYPILVIAAFCAPLQGLANIMVYLLPEIKKLRQRNTEEGRWRSISGDNVARSARRVKHSIDGSLEAVSRKSKERAEVDSESLVEPSSNKTSLSDLVQQPNVEDHFEPDFPSCNELEIDLEPSGALSPTPIEYGGPCAFHPSNAE